jgi:Ca2+-transporting ATPase
MNQRSRANQILLIKRQRNYPLAIPGDYSNLGFKGTLSQGHGSAYVTAIMETELGHIAQMIQSQDSSTLQIRLAAFGKRLSIVILIICTLIFMIGWLNGEAILSMLLTSISLAWPPFRPCLHLLPLHLPLVLND